MKASIQRFLRLSAAAAALLAAADARAVLKDHGPADPVLTWPLWYRDLNGTALGLCRSTAASPNAAAGGAPMCFPLPADPAGFAGNVGPEAFYANATVLLSNGGFSLRYVAALTRSRLVWIGSLVVGAGGLVSLALALLRSHG